MSSFGFGPSVVGFSLRAISRLRRARSLHPSGLMLSGQLQIDGSGSTGVAWLDQPAGFECKVRWSRASTYLWPIPDALGVAARFRTDAGEHDLLMTTTGLSTWSRHVIHLRLQANVSYTTVINYHAPEGSLIIGITPSSDRRIWAYPRSVRRALEAEPLCCNVVVARPGKQWVRVGTLTLATSCGDHGTSVSFDPVRNMLPGLRMPKLAERYRGAGYKDSQVGRDAPVS